MKKELLTKTECNALRGLAIIGIFLHNYCHWLRPVVKENEYQYFQHNADWFWSALQGPWNELFFFHVLSFFGHYGVPVFLFLSAYGLTMKYERTADNTGIRQVQGGLPLLRFVKYHWLKLFRMMIVGFVAFTMLDAVTRPVAITPGQRIPLNQSLAEWRNAQGDSVKLVPMAGQAKDQVRLCLDQQVQNVKRLSCTLWQVPTDWTTLSALPTYQGLRVVDERDDRQRTWQSSIRYPAYKAATVSSRGVRGDVLAGVLVHYVDTVPALIGPNYQSWSAVPWNGPGPDGQPLPRNDGVPAVPDVEGWSSIDHPGRTEPGQTHYTHEFENFLSHDSRNLLPDYVFTPQTVTLGMDVHMGRFFEGYQELGFFTPGRFLYSVDGEATPGRPLLTLSTQASFTTGDPASAASPLRSTSSYTLRAGDVVPFNQALQHWQDDKGNQATLKVLKGKAKDEFRLCLDQQLPAIKRLSCSHWRIPADWRLDISPEFKGISVADDRSAVGDSGTLYWQTRPEASKNLKSVKTLQRKALIRQKALQQR